MQVLPESLRVGIKVDVDRRAVLVAGRIWPVARLAIGRFAAVRVDVNHGLAARGGKLFVLPLSRRPAWAMMVAVVMAAAAGKGLAPFRLVQTGSASGSRAARSARVHRRSLDRDFCRVVSRPADLVDLLRGLVRGLGREAVFHAELAL